MPGAGHGECPVKSWGTEETRGNDSAYPAFLSLRTLPVLTSAAKGMLSPGENTAGSGWRIHSELK